MNEVQKQEALAQTQLQVEQGKAQFEAQRMQQEAEIKKQIMQLQFQFDMQLKQVDVGRLKDKEQAVEDRKDKRTRIQGTQQSKMIQQRQTDGIPVDFENEGDENIPNMMKAFEP